MTADGLTPWVAYAIALTATFAVNLPCGWWRAGVRKFSPAWFVAVHAPVPIVVSLRFALGLPFRWVMLPLFVAAYFGGQYVGSRLRQRGVQGEQAARREHGARAERGP
jgi:hypothetical protein